MLLICKLCHRATLHLATLPRSHSLAKHIERTYRSRKKHKALLHRLFEQLNVHPPKMETILPVCHHPHWKPGINIQVTDDLKKAACEDTRAEEEEDIYIYSDGLG